jgi:hypothetical protein
MEKIYAYLGMEKKKGGGDLHTSRLTGCRAEHWR